MRPRLPTGAIFTDNTDGTGTLTWTPTFDQAAAYPITFNADDGTDVTPLTVTITVANVNQIPVWVAQADTTINEGQTLSLTVTATDADGQTLTLTAANLPANASFADNLNNTGTLTFTPDFTQSGAYPIDFIANDGSGPVTQTVTVNVTNVNQIPVWVAQADTTINEGQTLSLIVTATDADGQTLTLTAANLPAANARLLTISTTPAP